MLVKINKLFWQTFFKNVNHFSINTCCNIKCIYIGIAFFLNDDDHVY